jgi:surface polysaccharide O-acyltransferase-like enzyme
MARLVWMDRLRGGAILAVVVLHAELQAVGATGGSLPAVHTVNAWLEPVRMPLLVALSGVLLAPALAKPTRHYVVGKLRALAWPYLVWSAVDIAQLQWRLAGTGDSLSWSWVAQVVHDPPTYLWFLAHLLVYYLAALALPATARTVAAPCLLALAAALHLADPGAGAVRLVWLGGWFLVGDVVGRAVRRRLVPRVASGRDPLGYVGRSSLVFYVSHLVVAIFVTDRLVSAGVHDPGVVFAACVAVPLAVGTALVEGRRWQAVDALFVAPFAAPADAPLRSTGAQADRRSLRPAG